MITAFPDAVTSESVTVSPLTAVTVKSGARCPTWWPTGMFGVAVGGTGVAVGRGVAVGAGRGVAVGIGDGVIVGAGATTGAGASVGAVTAVGAAATGAVVGAGAAVGAACTGVASLTAEVGSVPEVEAAADGASGSADAVLPDRVFSHSRHLSSPCRPPFLRRTIWPEASMPIAADCCVMR